MTVKKQITWGRTIVLPFKAKSTFSFLHHPLLNWCCIFNRLMREKHETFMIASNTKWNDYICEIVICLLEWLDECMRNGSKRLSKSNNTGACRIITYNPVKSRAAIQPYILSAASCKKRKNTNIYIFLKFKKYDCLKVWLIELSKN